MARVKTHQKYACDICGKEGFWGEGWQYKIILHRARIPWDQEIIVCSDTCAEEFDSMSTTEKRMLGHG